MEKDREYVIMRSFDAKLHTVQQQQQQQQKKFEDQISKLQELMEKEAEERRQSVQQVKLDVQHETSERVQVCFHVSLIACAWQMSELFQFSLTQAYIPGKEREFPYALKPYAYLHVRLYTRMRTHTKTHMHACSVISLPHKQCIIWYVCVATHLDEIHQRQIVYVHMKMHT